MIYDVRLNRMKRTLKILLLVTIVACGTGCTTGYWLDRGRDLADVGSVSFGFGLGAKARVSTLQVGALGAFEGLGLRRGAIFCESGSFNEGVFPWFPVPIGKVLFPLNVEECRLSDSVFEKRGKDYDVSSAVPVFLMPFWDLGNLYSAPPIHYYSEIEAVVALGLSVRVGFNPGELLDFLLGFAGVDMFNDDLERRKKQEIEQADDGSPEPNP
jgi:hypothetical protein